MDVTEDNGMVEKLTLKDRNILVLLRTFFCEKLGANPPGVDWEIAEKIKDEVIAEVRAASDGSTFTWQDVRNAIGKVLLSRLTIDENTSDGFHTFKELYRYRMLYNAAFFNQLAKDGKIEVVKSWKHHDGELCFGGGWFIVMANLPTGQISNHYEAADWDYFGDVPVAETAPEWDGHSAEEAADRLARYNRKTQEITQ